MSEATVNTEEWALRLNRELTEARARIATLEARLDEAKKALEPFALVAEHDIGEDETDNDLFRPIERNRAPRLTVGHFRAARRVREGD